MNRWGKSYVLQRAKSEDTKATGLSRMLIAHFKIVEESSGELIALYVSGMKKGTMKLKPGLTEDLEILCVLGVASWRDKLRRQPPRGGGGGWLASWTIVFGAELVRNVASVLLR